MFFRYTFAGIFFLMLSGCSTVGDVYDWAFDKNEEIETEITNENESQFELSLIHI